MITSAQWCDSGNFKSTALVAYWCTWCCSSVQQYSDGGLKKMHRMLLGFFWREENGNGVRGVWNWRKSPPSYCIMKSWRTEVHAKCSSCWVLFQVYVRVNKMLLLHEAVKETLRRLMGAKRTKLEVKGEKSMRWKCYLILIFYWWSIAEGKDNSFVKTYSFEMNMHKMLEDDWKNLNPTWLQGSDGSKNDES